MHKDVFGRSGDFTTSPEISQMFGEVGRTSVSIVLLLSINHSSFIVNQFEQCIYN